MEQNWSVKNQQLLDEREELYKEWMQLEKQNEELRDIINIILQKNSEVFRSKSSVLDQKNGFAKYNLPKISKNISESEKLGLFSLIIRFLCLSNVHARELIKSEFGTQLNNYLHYNGVNLDEQREFISILSNPKIYHFNGYQYSLSNKVDNDIRKFPDPITTAECYERYVTLIDKIKLKGNDNNNNIANTNKDGMYIYIFILENVQYPI